MSVFQIKVGKYTFTNDGETCSKVYTNDIGDFVFFSYKNESAFRDAIKKIKN